jgi:hypothetical protein
VRLHSLLIFGTGEVLFTPYIDPSAAGFISLHSCQKCSVATSSLINPPSSSAEESVQSISPIYSRLQLLDHINVSFIVGWIAISYSPLPFLYGEECLLPSLALRSAAHRGRKKAPASRSFPMRFHHRQLTSLTSFSAHHLQSHSSYRLLHV